MNDDSGCSAAALEPLAAMLALDMTAEMLEPDSQAASLTVRTRNLNMLGHNAVGDLQTSALGVVPGEKRPRTTHFHRRRRSVERQGCKPLLRCLPKATGRVTNAIADGKSLKADPSFSPAVLPLLPESLTTGNIGKAKIRPNCCPVPLISPGTLGRLLKSLGYRTDLVFLAWRDRNHVCMRAIHCTTRGIVAVVLKRRDFSECAAG